MSNSQVTTPYVGPRPFKREDRAVFFGRDREIAELIALIGAYSTVLLYAQSGAGKSSLIDAGLIPALEKDDIDILSSARVGVKLNTTPLEKIDNVYTFNVLSQWTNDIEPDVLAGMTLPEFLRSRPRPLDEFEVPVNRLVIFDQFEELFTTFAERWQDRRQFFEQVRDALKEDPHLSVLFSMREDFIAELDPYTDLMPRRMQIRQRLERLRRDAALLAVTKPLENTAKEFKPGVAERLVDDLMSVESKTQDGETRLTPGEFVEPVVLQVVCDSLWRAIGDHAKSTIDQADVDQYAQVTNVLMGFYDRCLNDVLSETSHQPRSLSEGQLRAWFGTTLINAAEKRERVRQGDYETGGIPNHAVALLVSRHIIHRVVERGVVGESPWYELSHERFIQPILKSNESWRLAQEQQRAEDERKRAEVEQVEAAKAKRNAEEERKRAEELWKKRRRDLARAGIVFLIIFGVVSSILTVFAIQNANEAVTQASIAQANRETAVIAGQEALTQAAMAEENRATAIAAQLEAETQAAAARESGSTAVAALEVAERERESSRSLALAGAARQAITAGNVDLAVALAVEANLITDAPPEARAALIAANRESFIQNRYPLGGSLNAIATTGELVVTGDSGGFLTVIGEEINRIQTGMVIRTVLIHDNGIIVAGCLQEAMIDGQCSLGQALLVSLENPDSPMVLAQTESDILSVVMASDMMVLGTSGGRVLVINPSTEELITTIMTDSAVNSLGLTADNHLLAGLQNATVFDINIDNEFSVTLAPDNIYSSAVNSIAVSDELVLVALQDGNLRLSRGGETLWTKTFQGSIQRAALSPDGAFGLIGLADGRVLMMDARNGQLMRALVGHTSAVTGLQFKGDGHQAVSSSNDGSVIVWDTHIPRLREYAAPELVRSVAFSPDQYIVAAGLQDGRVVLWDTQSGALLREYLLSENAVTMLAFTSDGRALMAFDQGLDGLIGNLGTFIVADDENGFGYTEQLLNEVTVFDIATETIISNETLTVEDIRPLFDPSVTVLREIVAGSLSTDWLENTSVGIAVSPDGQRIAFGTIYNELQIYDKNTFELLEMYPDQPDWVYAAAFSDDSRYLLTASNTTVTLWEPQAQPAALLQNVVAERYRPEFSCLQRTTYLIEPACVDNVAPTRTPYTLITDTTQVAPTSERVVAVLSTATATDTATATTTSTATVTPTATATTTATITATATASATATNTATMTQTIAVQATADDQGEEITATPDLNATLNAIVESTLTAVASGATNIAESEQATAAAQTTLTALAAQVQPSDTATATPSPTRTASITPSPTTIPAVIDGLSAIAVPAGSGRVSSVVTQTVIDLTGQDNIQRQTEFGSIQPLQNFAVSAQIQWGAGALDDSCGIHLSSSASQMAQSQTSLTFRIDRQGMISINGNASRARAIATGRNDTNTMTLLALGGRVDVYVNRMHVGSIDAPESYRPVMIATTGNRSGAAGCTFNEAWVWEITNAGLIPTRTPAPTATPTNTPTPLPVSGFAPITAQNAASIQPINAVTATGDSVTHLVISPDGKLVASGASDGTILVLNASDGQIAFETRGLGNVVQALEFSPDGRYFVAAGPSERTRLWDTTTGTLVHTFTTHRTVTRDTDFSPDSRYLALSAIDGSITLWDLQSSLESPVKTLSGHERGVNVIDFSPDGTKIASIANDNRLLVWAVESGEIIHEFTGYPGGVMYMSFTPDGSRIIASNSATREINIYSLAENGLERVLLAANGVVKFVLNKEGTKFAAAMYNGNLALWDLSSDAQTAALTFERQLGDTMSVEFAANDTLLVSVYLDNQIRLWDTRSGELITALSGHRDGILTLAVSPDSSLIASGSRDKTVWLWGVNTQRCVIQAARDANARSGPNTTFEIVPPALRGGDYATVFERKISADIGTWWRIDDTRWVSAINFEALSDCAVVPLAP